MKTTTRIVLRHYLSFFESLMELRKVPQITPFFEDFFTRDELITIIKSMFGDIVFEQHDFTDSTKEELLEVISDDVYILKYYLKQWDEDLEAQIALHPVSVWETLNQLGLQTHYLGEKALAYWDTYDKNNYRALQYKAGKIIRVYGIYDISVKKEDVHNVDSPPKRFFEVESQAITFLAEGIEAGMFNEDEVHILSFDIARS